MSNKEKYTILLLEKYCAYKGLCGADVYDLFEKHGIFDYINNTYEALHTQDTNFVVGEIDKMFNK
jgi:hypothetical protein